MSETPGKRLFQIRAACGKGEREPEPLDAFALRVYRATKERYAPMKLSKLERDIQRWTVRDTEILSRVDPLERGAAWLAYGDEPGEDEPPMEYGSKPKPGDSGNRKHG